MKVLIVGCRGMLGSELMDAYAPAHEVIGVDLEEMDISDGSRCRSRVEGIRPGLIINAAALTDVDYCEDHEDQAMRVNGQGVGNLAAAASSVGALVVHYSTDYVFDGRKGSAYHEEDAPNPQSVYGRSKLLGEELLRSRSRSHLNLRTAWLFGRSGRNFIRTITNAARSATELRVVDDQRGCPSYALDLARHTVRMIEAGCRGTYHLTNSGSCTWYELARKALEWAGLEGVAVTPVSTAEFPRPAPRPPYSVLANSRLEREGLPAMRPWQEAVREYVQQHIAPSGR